MKVWQQIERQVAKDRRFDAVMPKTAVETHKVAADAVKAGIDRVIVVGGDGTLASVLGELAFSDTSLGVIPAGTGNDFCRNAGIPRNPETALALALRPQTRQIDLGQAAGFPFLNVAGLGFDAEVAAAAARLPNGLGGTLPYLLGSLSTLVWYRPVQVDVTVDDQRFSGPAMLVAVANGRCYGGGMQIAPRARFDDGELDICIVGSLTRRELVGLLRHVYLGTHIAHPKVRMVRGRQVRLEVNAGVRLHADGEPLRWDALKFEVLPGALAVALPSTSPPCSEEDRADIPDTHTGTPESVLWWDF